MERVSRLDAVDEDQIKQDSARIKEIMDVISSNILCDGGTGYRDNQETAVVLSSCRS